MRIYLVDGSNAVRRGAYDPRFPEVEQARTKRWLGKLCALAEPLAGRVKVEVFFDGPRREVTPVSSPVSLRFALDGNADDAILGSARSLLAAGRGAVAVTEDGALARVLEAEGARVIAFGELERRLRERKA